TLFRSFLRGFWLPAGLLFVYGVNTSTGGVAYTTILQRRVPDQLRGRVFTTLGVTWQLGRLISIGLAGVAVDAVSIQALYLAVGGLLLLAGVLGLHLLAGADDDIPT
ncbi:MAG: MFS transporter, partial [Myxococcota bacterium]